MDLIEKIRNVPDFPKPGIGFKDITTLLADGKALRQAVQMMLNLYENQKIDSIIGIESRGFIFAGILAYELGIGMIPVRKPGKLPYKTIAAHYDLEYGTDSLEIHADAVKRNDRVLIVDDLLATGGTVEATASLVEQLGGIVVGCCFLIELDFLNARKRLTRYSINSLIHFDV
ncbi:adenine phosphoribosyltransferase [candidate division KSB1 bacterium]|nr:adenine phosphoribosyltransferase [candidate division KSB1 bacterium]RQW00487.1 MAG: adenine phosphoribosyltransferase [candidate division KSB1 bacterium]